MPYLIAKPSSELSGFEGCNLKHSSTFVTLGLSHSSITPSQLLRMKLSLLTRLFPALLLVLAFSEAVMAQTGGPMPGGGTGSPTAIPLDGGASILLASGVAYGIKHLRERRRKK